MRSIDRRRSLKKQKKKKEAAERTALHSSTRYLWNNCFRLFVLLAPVECLARLARFSAHDANSESIISTFYVVEGWAHYFRSTSLNIWKAMLHKETKEEEEEEQKKATNIECLIDFKRRRWRAPKR